MPIQKPLGSLVVRLKLALTGVRWRPHLYLSLGMNLLIGTLISVPAAMASYLPTTGSNIGIGTSTPSGGLVVMNGNVGIGTWSPNSGLELKGSNASIISTGGTNTNAAGAGELYVQGDLEVDGTIYGDGSGITALPAGLAAGGWVDGGTNVYQTTTTDSVGIGTTTPTAATTLEIVKQSSSSPLKISSTATAAGDLFNINPTGLVGIGTTLNSSRTGLSVMNGNVGIGTWSPGTLLEVVNNQDASTLVNVLNSSNTNNAQAGFQAGANFTNLAVFFLYSPANAAVIPWRNRGVFGATSGTAGFILSAYSANQTIDFQTGGIGVTNLRMRIDGSGNVGIGTTSPVNGTSIMNGNVGIGTWSPNSQLEVKGGSASVISTGGTNTNATSAGELYVQGDLEIDGTIYGDGSGITALPAGLAAGGWTDDGTVVRLSTGTDNVGIGTTTPVGGLAVMNGNVGIGTWSPTQRLQVIGTVDATAFVGDGSGLLNVTGTNSGWSDGGTNVYTSTTTDTVGIGTTTPAASTTLEIVKQSSNAPLKISSTATGAGDFLVVGSSGRVGIGTTDLGTTGSALSIMNGNVGIGTWKPAFGLDLGGELRIKGSTTSPTGEEGLQLSYSLSTQTATIQTLKHGTTFYDMNIYASDLTLRTWGNDDLHFSTAPAFTAIERMTLTELGNFGIGTTTPGSMLSVTGGASFGSYALSSAPAGGLIVAGNVGIGTTTPVGGLSVMNGNVGIGTWVPSAELQVQNSGANNAILLINTIKNQAPGNTAELDLGAGQFFDQTNSPRIYSYMTYLNGGAGSTTDLRFDTYNTGRNTVMTLQASGNVGIGTTTPVGALTVMNGNVGIGTWSPTSRLQVIGTVDATAFSGDGSGLTNVTGANSGWLDGGTNVYQAATTDSVGIGTTTPAASTTLEIVKQSTSAPLKISSTATGAGDFLNVSSAGLVGIGTTLNSASTGLSIMNGNVGIGTWSPDGALIVRSGNVGIGLATPLYKFQIGTGGEVNNIIGQIGNVVIGDTDFGAFGAGTGIWSDGNSLGLNAWNGSLIFKTNNPMTERMRITLTGSVGIGTTTPVGGTSVMNGNVGIGTWSPNNRLEVVGTVAATAFTGDGSALTGITAGGWTDGGTNVYTSSTTDNVGIGTTTPNAATLEVVKNAAQSPLRVSSTATGAGDFLNVSSAGLIGIGTTLNSASTGLSIMNGNVGIGTWNPSGKFVSKGNGTTTGTNLAVADSSGAIGARFLDNGSLLIGAAYPTPSAGTIVLASSATARIFFNNGGPTNYMGIGGYNTGTVSKLGLGYGAITSAAVNDVMTITDGGNVGIGTTEPLGGLTVMSGNVGIGTWSPTSALQVVGTVAATAFTGDGSALTGISAGGWIDGGTNVFQSSTSDVIGIGTTTPAASTTLEIVKQSSNDPFKISSTATGAGDFLNVSSAGLVGIGTTLNSVSTGLAVMNGNVGIGTWKPRTNLDVAGSIYVATAIQGSNGGQLVFGGGTSTWNANTSLFPTVDNTSDIGLFFGGTLRRPRNLYLSGNIGIGTWVTNGSLIISTGNVGLGTINPVNGTAIMNGNVGIGTWSPTQALEVVGTVKATAFTGDGSGLTGISAGGWTDGGTNVYTSVTTDNVGIGTTTPNAATLEVVKNAAQSPLRVSSTATGAGDFLNVSSAGLIGIGTTLNSASTGLSIMNGNVGIGTWSPTSKLQVIGTVAATAFTGDGSGLTGIAAGGWVDGGTNVYQAATTDVVGIGTTTPASATTLEIVKQSSNAPLKISSSASGAGDFLVIDSAGNIGIGTTKTTTGALSIMNGNVGIGTWSPTSLLHIFGRGSATNPALRIDAGGGPYLGWYYHGGIGNWILKNENGDGIAIGIGGTPNTNLGLGAASQFTFNAANSPNAQTPDTSIGRGGAGKLYFGNGTLGSTAGTLIAASIGLGTTNPVGGLSVMSGNVGVGTWSPTSALQVVGTVAATAFVGDGSGLTGLPSGGGWVDGGTNVYQTTTTDVVGIGTTTPAASTTLEIVKQSSSAPLKISSSATGVGDFLNVSSAGLVGIGTSLNSTSTGLTIMNGNVGIGTWSPSQKLTIAGGQILMGPLDVTSSFINFYNTSYKVGASSGLELHTGSTDVIRFLVGGVEKMRMGSNGNVGIGTITAIGGLSVMNGNVGIGTWSPTSALQVVGTVNASGNVGVGNAVTDSTGTARITITTTKVEIDLQ